MLQPHEILGQDFWHELTSKLFEKSKLLLKETVSRDFLCFYSLNSSICPIRDVLGSVLFIICFLVELLAFEKDSAVLARLRSRKETMRNTNVEKILQ